MEKFNRQLGLILIGLILPVSYSIADNHNLVSEVSESQQTSNEASAGSIHYIPPATEKLQPEIRVAKGGVRGNADCSSLPTITLLVPNHVAYTTQVQPVLYFHSTGVIDIPVTLTLNIDDELINEPLINEQILINKVALGINEIKMADYGVSFELDKEYEWIIQIGKDKNDTDKCSPVARANVIKIKEITAGYDDLHDKARIFAEKGIWYDALAELMKKINHNSDEALSKEQINKFLLQGNLTTFIK